MTVVLICEMWFDVEFDERRAWAVGSDFVKEWSLHATRALSFDERPHACEWFL